MRLQQQQYENQKLIYNESRDLAGSPSSEGTNEPAPTRHEPQNDDQRIHEKSKYEAQEVYRSPKGNRL
ncbi:hypothetical protein RUND412_005981 [Rhizina undulata]